MANEFHRLTAPPTDGTYVRSAWSGTIPQAGVLDWMNNDPATPLVQAPADPPLSNPANPYLGTNWIGGKEDAVDLYANRPHRALSENVDLIDTSIRRAIPVTAVKSWTGGADTYTFDPADLVYGGGVSEFIRLVNKQDLSQVMDSVGGAVRVLSSTHDPFDAAMFATNVALTWTESVPVGQYYVVYGAKNCVAELTAGDILMGGFGGAVQIPVKVQTLFQKLHAPIGSIWQQDWDASWGTTIEDLRHSGLNERYRRSSIADGLNPPAYFNHIDAVDIGWESPATADTGGGGGWILRDGMAPTVFSVRHTTTPLATDKLNACFRAVLADEYATHGGSVGVAVQGARPIMDDAYQFGPGFAAHMVHRPVFMTSTNWYSANAVTNIPTVGAAFVQYEVIDTGVSELTCELQEVNARFSLTTGGLTYSAVTTGFDMLEVSDQVGVIPVKFWLIHRLIGGSKCVLRQLNGDVAPVGTANGGYPGSPTVTNVSVTWHTIISTTSDGAAERQLQRALPTQYSPGWYPMPSPANYGTMFLAAMPWLGVTSNYSLNERQQFDQGVVGIFGSVLGNPVAGALPVPGMPPSPHPDIALQVGSRNPMVADINPGYVLGQTPLNPYVTVLSNGYTYLPKLFVGEIGAYAAVDPDFTINCEAGFRAAWLQASSLTSHPQLDNGLKLYPKYGWVNRYLAITDDGNLALSHDTNYLLDMQFENAVRELDVHGILGYKARKVIGEVFELNANAAIVYLPLDQYGEVKIINAGGGSPTVEVRLQQFYDNKDQAGSVYPFRVYFDKLTTAGSGVVTLSFTTDGTWVLFGGPVVVTLDYTAGGGVAETAFIQMFIGRNSNSPLQKYIGLKVEHKFTECILGAP